MRKISRVWHPMTQHALAPEEIHIESAEGAYLYAKKDRKILDAISSWWVITHGHCHPKISEAVRAQAEKLDQVIFAGFTHEPAEALTEKLLHFTPRLLEFVFYSDSGSTAVESALKMAIGYHAQEGKPRHRILALEGGYHGDTFGAMSVGSRGVFNKLYEPFLFDVDYLSFPEPGKEDRCLQKLKDILKKHGDEIAAFIFEPLVQGSAGMQMYTPETLKEMSDLCKKHGVLMIADEVMTGFGRVGTKFACEKAGITPDIMCLSKGLTGGFLPMGATLCTRDVYKAFYKKDRSQMFFHSTSFTGNALSCAAAVANLGLWEEDDVLKKIEAIEKSHLQAARWFDARPDVAVIRTTGTIFAIEVPDTNKGYLSDLAPKLQEFYLKHDVLLRPIGNSVYILPPYCVTQEDLDKTYDVIWRSLDFLRDGEEEREEQVA